MKDGFLRVGATAPTIRVADCSYNTTEILKAISVAQEKEIALLAFPELCLCGATCNDLFFDTTLQDGVKEALATILEKTKNIDLLLAIGLPWATDGDLYNVCVILQRGKILGFIPKSNLTAAERRFFVPAPVQKSTLAWNGSIYPFDQNLLFSPDGLPACKIAVSFENDLFTANINPQPAATLFLSLSASPTLLSKTDTTQALLTAQSLKSHSAYLFVNAGAGESTTDGVYGGERFCYENGVCLAKSLPFSSNILYTEIDFSLLESVRQKDSLYHSSPFSDMITYPYEKKTTPLSRKYSDTPFFPKEDDKKYTLATQALTLQAQGLAKRLSHTGCNTPVIGISGGLDSTLALLATVGAVELLGLPHSSILAVTMPCFGTTSRTKSNAQLLCEKLGVTLLTIEIGESVSLHLKEIGHDPSVHNAAYENAQARERTQVLMDLANDRGGMVIGTGDLSELALGWATYNGDHMSMYSVNASIPKTMVRLLVDYYAKQTSDTSLASILFDILDTPVSPELLPAKDGQITQQTEDIVGPYPLHDFFLYHVYCNGFSPTKLYRLATYVFATSYSKEEILKWLNIFFTRFFSQQYKRSCLPDGAGIGYVSLSPRAGFQMPSDACVTLWKSEMKNLSPTN